jgi:GT2 family glycosyltransferase
METAAAQAMNGYGSVAAIVVTYNSQEVISDCLDSLGRALDGVHGSSIIVADNRSHDGTCELADHHATRARLLRLDRNGGYAAGFNAGAAVAGPVDALLVLNPDVRLAPGSVLELLKVLALPATGVAVPKVLSPEGQVDPDLKREPTVLRALGEAVLGGHRAGRFEALGEMVTVPEQYEKPTCPDWAGGSVMLISRRCYDQLGEWDESFFHGSEETEFCLRARDHGWLVRYTPTAVAVHLGGGGEQSPYLRSLMVANRLELFRRRRGPARAAAYRGALLLNEALRAGRGPQHLAALLTLLTGRRPRLDGQPSR